MRILRAVMLAVLVSLVSGCGEAPPPEPVPIERQRIPEGVLIAHALGGINAISGSNSPQAFVHNYGRGFRWFEVDLALTADEEMVGFHLDMEAALGLEVKVAETSTEEFLSRRFWGRFRLMTFDELLTLMESRPDAFLITDTKSWDPPIVEAFIREVARFPESVRRRIVPQLYRESDFDALEKIELALGEFPYVILTLYAAWMPDEKVVELLGRPELRNITASDRRFSSALAEKVHAQDAAIFVHTINDRAEAASFVRAGADGIYTDFVTPLGR